MKQLLLEIRDRGTCIPVIATQMQSDNPIVSYYLRRAGYPQDGSSIMLMVLYDGRATNDPYEWGDDRLRMGARTMRVAHNWIIDHWSEGNLSDGDVVDVQVILGESQTPKVSERLTHPMGAR